jgi:predicted metal-dependent peptidase
MVKTSLGICQPQNTVTNAERQVGEIMPDEETGLSLSEAFTYLVSARQRNFYARVINALVRVEKPGLNTMAVGLDREGRYVFYYDPEFVKRCPLQELVLSCEHEVYHLLLGHIPRYLELLTGLVDQEERRKFKAVMNIAADCADNELMRQEPKFKEQWGKWFYGCEETTEPDGRVRTFLVPENYKLPKGQPFEVYQFMLLQNAKKISKKIGGMTFSAIAVPVAGDGDEGKSGGPQQQPQNGQGQGQAPTPYQILDAHFNGVTSNSHQFWDTGVDEKATDEIQGLADKLRQQAKGVIRQAVHEHTKSRGTLPAGMKELIEALLKPSTIPWPEVLHNMVVRTRQTKVGRGMSRPNRRMYGIPGVLPFPGRARDRKFTVYFILDTSGSMSMDDCKMGLAELCHLAKADADITIYVMYCDVNIGKLYEVKSVDDVDWEVVGRGGTDFNEPFIKIQQLLRSDKAGDIVVYATDGYAPDPQPENRVPIPVIWLITPDGTIPSPDYGFHIRMEPF